MADASEDLGDRQSYTPSVLRWLLSLFAVLALPHVAILVTILIFGVATDSEVLLGLSEVFKRYATFFAFVLIFATLPTVFCVVFVFILHALFSIRSVIVYMLIAVIIPGLYLGLFSPSGVQLSASGMGLGLVFGALFGMPIAVLFWFMMWWPTSKRR